MAVHLGCGSWTDDEYVGVLYAKGLAKTSRLSVYAEWFDRVEVNSFYHAIPKREYVQRWVDQTPAKFRFDIKLPKEFSENPAGAARDETVARFLHAVQPVLAANKLGVYLLTMPPSFGPPKRSLTELDGVIEKLRPHVLAVELRHRGWLEGSERATTLDYFHAQQLVWVSVDVAPVDSPRILPLLDVASNPQHAYLRLHGRNPAYGTAGSTEAGHYHDYTPDELGEIAARIKTLAAKAKNVHVTCNNHVENFAPKAAIALKRLLGQPTLSGPPGPPSEQTELF